MTASGDAPGAIGGALGCELLLSGPGIGYGTAGGPCGEQAAPWSVWPRLLGLLHGVPPLQIPGAEAEEHVDGEHRQQRAAHAAGAPWAACAPCGASGGGAGAGGPLRAPLALHLCVVLGATAAADAGRPSRAGRWGVLQVKAHVPVLIWLSPDPYWLAAKSVTGSLSQALAFAVRAPGWPSGFFTHARLHFAAR